MTSQYEIVTNKSTPMITNMMGTTRANAARPDVGRHLGEDLFGTVCR